MGEYQVPLFSDSTDFRILPPGFRDSGADQFNWLSENSHAFLVAGKVSTVGNGHRRFPVDRQLPTLIGLSGLVGGGDLAKESTCQLRWNLEFLPDRPVELLLEFPGIEFFRFKNDWRQPVQRVKIPEAQSVVMLYIPGKLDLDCTDCLHQKISINYLLNYVNKKIPQPSTGGRNSSHG